MSGLFGERVDIKKRWWALREVGGTADVGGARRLSGFLFTSGAKKESMTVRRELSFSPRQQAPQQAQQQPGSPATAPTPVDARVVSARVSARGPPGCSCVSRKEARSRSRRAKAESPRYTYTNKTNQKRTPSGRPVMPPPLSPALPFGAGLADLPG